MALDQLGTLVRSARKALGLSQKELARRAHVSQRLWAEFERDERPNVSLATALRMLGEVGVSIRVSDARGSSHELRDPATTAAARQARAAVRRATWSGRQIRLAQEGESDTSAAPRVERLSAVARVSEQAYVVARAKASSSRALRRR